MNRRSRTSHRADSLVVECNSSKVATWVRFPVGASTPLAQLDSAPAFYLNSLGEESGRLWVQSPQGVFSLFSSVHKSCAKGAPFASLAQMVEHLLCIIEQLKVLGSIPKGGIQLLSIY